MRLIEQFSLVMARILFRKKSHQYDEALFEIGNCCGQLLGLDVRQVHSLSDGELIEWLKIGGNFDAEKCLILAELLKEEAEIQDLVGRIDKQQLHMKYSKSFSLYLEALNHDKDLGTGQVMRDIRTVAEKLDVSNLSLHLKFKMFRFFEVTGDFGRAEDLLYELLEANYPDGPKEGLAFYKRILKKSDDELNAGNLPRSEVEEGLLSLKRKGTEP
jgi:hypothetical protein